MPKSLGKSAKSPGEPSGRRAIMLKMDEELRNELDVLATTRKQTIQQLGIEAICDLLRKHDRPVNLRDALRKSAGEAGGHKAGAASTRGAARKTARKSSRPRN